MITKCVTTFLIKSRIVFLAPRSAWDKKRHIAIIMFIEVFTPFLNLIYAIMTSSLISIAQANKDTVARYNQSKVSHRARIWRHNKYARDGLRIIQINGLRISSSKKYFSLRHLIWIPHTLKSRDFENYVFVPTRSPPSRDSSHHVISDRTGRRRSRGRGRHLRPDSRFRRFKEGLRKG